MNIEVRAWNNSTKEMSYINDLLYWLIENGIHNLKRNEGSPFIFMLQIGIEDDQQRKIYSGDIVSFDGYMTADDTLGIEPNGFIYGEDDIYTVMWNDILGGWDLLWNNNEKMKYKRDTRALLMQGCCKIIGNIYQNPIRKNNFGG